MSNEAVPDAWPDYELIISNDLINYDVLHTILQFTVLVKTLWFLNVLINEVSYLNAYQGCIYLMRILEWFLKDHVTLKTGVMAAENSALPSQK